MRSRIRAIPIITVLITLGLLPALASAQVTRTLERSVARLSRTGLRAEVTAVSSPRLSVWLRPEAKVIGVARGSSQHGFRLGADGKLGAADRAELDRLLRDYAPAATPRTVQRTLLGELKQLKAESLRLRRQDPLIDGLLRRSAALKGNDEVEIWSGRGGWLAYRPGAQTLVGHGLITAEGFRLEGGVLTPEARDGLRRFLDRHARR